MFYFWEGALRPPNFEILLMFSSYLRSSVLDGGGVVEHKFIILDIESRFTYGEANLY